MSEIKTFVDHPIVALEYADGRPRPSDQSIAMAVLGGCHCQFHPRGYADCATFAWILDEAERIERGEKSHFDAAQERRYASEDSTE